MQNPEIIFIRKPSFDPYLIGENLVKLILNNRKSLSIYKFRTYSMDYFQKISADFAWISHSSSRFCSSRCVDDSVQTFPSPANFSRSDQSRRRRLGSATTVRLAASTKSRYSSILDPPRMLAVRVRELSYGLDFGLRSWNSEARIERRGSGPARGLEYSLGLGQELGRPVWASEITTLGWVRKNYLAS